MSSGRRSGEPECVEKSPVLLDEFRESMREAGVEYVVERAIEAYLVEAPRRMAALEEAVAAEDWTGVQEEAHGMRSGSQTIRAERLGRLLAGMEEAGRKGDGEAVVAGLPVLRQVYEDVMEYLNGERSE